MAFFTLLLTACDDQQLEQKSKYIESCLQKKYQKPFKVIKSRYTGVKERTDFYVKAVDDDDVFTAMIHGYGTSSQRLSEEYWFAKLNYQFERKYVNEIKGYFKYPTFLEGGQFVFPNRTVNFFAVEKVEPKYLEMDYVEKHAKEFVEGYKFDFFTFAPEDDKEFDDVFNGIFKLVKELKKKDITYISLQFRVYNKAEIMNKKDTDNSLMSSKKLTLYEASVFEHELPRLNKTITGTPGYVTVYLKAINSVEDLKKNCIIKSFTLKDLN